MGVIASIFKTLSGDEYASRSVANYRQSICGICTYRKNGFCGTPIIGETIIYKGEQKRLCGCVTNEKTLLKNESCPLNKW